MAFGGTRISRFLPIFAINTQGLHIHVQDHVAPLEGLRCLHEGTLLSGLIGVRHALG
jgi:hypothetical protein